MFTLNAYPSVPFVQKTLHNLHIYMDVHQHEIYCASPNGASMEMICHILGKQMDDHGYVHVNVSTNDASM